MLIFNIFVKKYDIMNKGDNMNDFIGIFDSGIGGLSVLEEIRKLLPYENILYFADEKNCPYGTKTIEEVRKITLGNIEYLKGLGAKIIVIACNTATSSIIDILSENKENIIGVVEPTAKTALSLTKSKKIGVFATDLTVKTKIYDKFLPGVEVKSEGCSDFVTSVEDGDFDSNELKESIKKHFEHISDVDTLILGCTHFKFIKNTIQSIYSDLTIVDSGIPTTVMVRDTLIKKNIVNNNLRTGELVFVTSGSVSKSKEQINKLGIDFDEIKAKR